VDRGQVWECISNACQELVHGYGTSKASLALRE